MSRWRRLLLAVLAAHPEAANEIHNCVTRCEAIGTHIHYLHIVCSMMFTLAWGLTLTFTCLISFAHLSGRRAGASEGAAQDAANTEMQHILWAYERQLATYSFKEHEAGPVAIIVMFCCCFCFPTLLIQVNKWVWG